MKRTFFITGGCGFIGSCFIRNIIKNSNHKIVNIDRLSYASNKSLNKFKNDTNYKLYKNDINDEKIISKILRLHKPDYILHFAAESHVDRSIDEPEDFIKSNVLGTYKLLHNSYEYWSKLSSSKKKRFRFIMISTDEVYGSLKKNEKQFEETNAYKPNSPYAASKASSDHLARAWYKTYGLPVIITNTSNNYGPWQFPEKLIPLTIQKCINKESIPVYGNGRQVRDWINVEDHIEGIKFILNKGNIGEKYNIGSNKELQNIEVVRTICDLYDEIILNKPYTSRKLISFVNDRPGHDIRYAINNKKISKLGWKPNISWEDGIKDTITWYLNNNKYLMMIEKNKYSGKRLGNIKR